MEGQSDAGDPPPEVALAASRRVGPWRKNRCDRHGRGDIFRQRGRQPIADAPASKPIGKSDRREGGVALLVDSLVCHAGHHKGSGDPWKRAGRYGTTLHGGGSAGWFAHRFVLGPQDFLGRACCPEAACARPS